MTAVAAPQQMIKMEEPIVKTHVCCKHIEPDARTGVKDYLANLCQQYLDKHEDTFEQAPVLHATVKKDTGHDAYSVVLRLAAGAHQLVARNQDHDLLAALGNAAETLEWRLQQYVARRRAHEADAGRARRERWPDLQRALDRQPLPSRAHFARLLLPRLTRLTGFVQRELSYLRSEDRLASHYPSASEVLDDVLVRALESTPADFTESVVAPWLHRLVVEVLADYVEAHLVGVMESTPLDGVVELDPTEADVEDEDWAEEPLSLTDLIPAHTGVDAFEAISSAEAQRRTLTLMRTLPMRWRRVVSFHYIDELPIETIAETLHMSRDEVRAAIDAALGFLRERLRDQGVEAVDSGWPAEYVVPAPEVTDFQSIVDELSALIDTAEQGSKISV